MTDPNFFKDIPDNSTLPQQGKPATSGEILPSVQVGAGNTVFRVDQNGLWLGARRYVNAPFRVSMAGIVTISAPNSAWVAVSFLNSWVNYNASFNQAAYLIDPIGFVHLRGLVKSGTVGAGTPIFTLPAGFRPQYQELHDVQSNGALGRVDILTNGNVEVITGNNTWVSLDGITFKAYQ